jgi:hypothetical protein
LTKFNGIYRDKVKKLTKSCALCSSYQEEIKNLNDKFESHNAKLLKKEEEEEEKKVELI